MRVTAAQLAELLDMSIYGARQVIYEKRIENTRVSHGVYEITDEAIASWKAKKCKKAKKRVATVPSQYVDSLEGLHPIARVADKIGVSRQYGHYLINSLNLRKYKHYGVRGVFVCREDAEIIYSHIDRVKPPFSEVLK